VTPFVAPTSIITLDPILSLLVEGNNAYYKHTLIRTFFKKFKKEMFAD
jgi:hypothetical protein